MTGNTFKTWFAQNGRENEDVSGRLSEEVEFFKQENHVQVQHVFNTKIGR